MPSSSSGTIFDNRTCGTRHPYLSTSPSLIHTLTRTVSASVSLACAMLGWIVRRVMCALLDIPVKDATNVVEPLHVMMSLYLSFKNNPIYNPPTDTEMA